MKSASLALATALALSALSAPALADDANRSRTRFTLSSPDLTSGVFDNLYVLNGFGCTGGNISPELTWSNVPPGTLSLALQVYDPDAPTGSGFWHWAVYNIPPTSTGLPRSAGNNPLTLPPGAFGGNTDFVGDKPHRYVFTLFALGVPDVQAAGGVPATGTAALYGFVINKGLGTALLGTASFTARYGR